MECRRRSERFANRKYFPHICTVEKGTNGLQSARLGSQLIYDGIPANKERPKLISLTQYEENDAKIYLSIYKVIELLPALVGSGLLFFKCIDRNSFQMFNLQTSETRSLFFWMFQDQSLFCIHFTLEMSSTSY